MLNDERYKDWQVLLDDKTGRVYFWNSVTNATQWEDPVTGEMPSLQQSDELRRIFEGISHHNPRLLPLSVHYCIIAINLLLCIYRGRSHITVWLCLLLAWRIAQIATPSNRHWTGFGWRPRGFHLSRLFIVALAHMIVEVYLSTPGGQGLSQAVFWVSAAAFTATLCSIQMVAAADPGIIEKGTALAEAGDERICTTCHCHRPIRSKHDPFLYWPTSGRERDEGFGRCVAKFDHTCPFTK